MKIDIDKNLVRMMPESKLEEADLAKIWRCLISCTGNTKTLLPVGEYIPGKESSASFYIEGMTKEQEDIIGNFAQEKGAYYCSICNKSVQLEKGDEISLCCGRRMEFVG